MLNRREEGHYISPRKIHAYDDFDVKEYRGLKKLGINLTDGSVRQLMERHKYAADTLQPTVTVGSIGTPVQFLQNWLPGFVFIVTAARKIDNLVGMMISGSWEDEQVVQGVMERTGSAVPYGDTTNVPMGSWNVNYVYRSVVRFEEGLKVGNLEAARAARQLVDDAGMKREAAALSLEIMRNNTGFNGFNGGNNLTYGFLNDPNEPAYVQVATGANGFTWSVKSFLEICNDIRTAIQTLRNNSQDTIDPENVDLTLAVATGSVDYLTTVTDFGISVRDWLTNAYPRCRVESAPQLNAAHSSDNVFYLYAEQINDMSTDGGRTFLQVVPTKFQVLGVQKLAKGYEEDYSNATSGVMCKRPYAMVRYFDI